ncbi:MAG: hypothetical protein H7Y11_05975, partial [Armatimonadetes bacterium]|nr:hypothetical protein [Anaerolineae bacterium]
MAKLIRISPLVLVLMLALAISASVNAGNVTLTIGSGTTDTPWFISGESTLVINGFDLDSFSVTRPVQVDRINLSVIKATPGKLVEAVVYQDTNGGSPVDAKLVGRKTIDI